MPRKFLTRIFRKVMFHLYPSRLLNDYQVEVRKISRYKDLYSVRSLLVLREGKQI